MMAKKSKSSKPRSIASSFPSHSKKLLPDKHNYEDHRNGESDEDDEFDIRKWTSRHYDNDDDTDDARATTYRMDDEAAERDLYDPKLVTNNKTNSQRTSLFDDANNGGEGADEDGVFLRYVYHL